MAITFAICCVLLTGCNSNNNAVVNSTLHDRFVIVNEINGGLFNSDMKLYVDKETNVMYWSVSDNIDQIGLTVLLDENGAPLLYSGSDLYYE